MKTKKITYRPKSRQDISNPRHRECHTDLLKRADVKLFNGNFKIETLENGKIRVHSR